MNLGYLRASTGAAVDASIVETVARLEARAIQLAGVVPTGLGRVDILPAGPGRSGEPARTDRLRVLPGQDIVSRDEDGTGHGLSPETMERINEGIGRVLPGARGLVLHRFTDLEARGWGFAPALAAAIDLGKPILVGLEDVMMDRFRELVGPVARALASPAEAAHWLASFPRSLP